MISARRAIAKGADDLDRMPQLAASLAAARRNGKAPVVVAKLERLSRDGHFISGLMAHKTPFLVAELVMPKYLFEAHYTPEGAKGVG